MEDRTPFVTVALQECERMNLLCEELRRSLQELELGLKVMTNIYAFLYFYILRKRTHDPSHARHIQKAICN